MNAPAEPPFIIKNPVCSEIIQPESYQEYRDAVVESAKLILPLAFPNDLGLDAAVAASRELNAIAKQVEEEEDRHRKPLNAFLKLLRGTRDTFLAPVAIEKTRIADIINNYQRLALKDKEARERKALEDQQAAQRAAAEAEAKAAAAQKAIEDAKNAEDKAKAEDALAKAQAAQERAELKNSNATAALSVPTNTPKGLTTRVRYDFEVTQPGTFYRQHPNWFNWKKDEEALKLDRAGLLKALNNDEHEWAENRPPDGQDSVQHAFGLRVYLDVRNHTR